MNLKLPILFCMLLLSAGLYAQPVKKAKGTAQGESFTYYTMQPAGQAKGLLILLPAAGEKPQTIFKKTQLPGLLAAKGYITLIPEVHTLLYADEYSLAVIDQLLSVAAAEYKVSNFVIGGLSSGGAIAAQCAEHLVEQHRANGLKGLIVVDSPLDLERIYASALRQINYPCAGIIARQGNNIKAQLESRLGGPPAAHRDDYIKYSAFTASAADGGNARYLLKLPVRLYSEPDVAFVQRTYCIDIQLTDLNATDSAGLNTFLQQAGNTQSRYISTQGKGFHSWNIIDAAECAKWVESINP